MPKNRDGKTGLPYPTPVDPGGYTYLCLPVPNHTLYRQALSGALSDLCKSWNWQQIVGTDNQGSYEAAELWRKAISMSQYLDECGGSMTCDDIANCIETSEAVRNAIGGIVAPRSPLADYAYPPGEPLPTGGMTEQLNPIDDCSFDAFWAQVDQYIEYMVNLGQDTLEQLEFYSNALEAGENVPMGQLVGKLKNASTTGKVMEFLNWAGEVMKEAYEASNTQSNRNALKCDIFCAGRDACSITIQGTLDVINERVGGLFTPASLNSIDALVDMLLTVATNPAIALDLWIGFLMGTAKTLSMFGVQGIDETLQLMLAVAVNDANNDWVLLCDDCPVESDCHDLKNGPIVTTPLNNNSAAYGEQVAGQGYKAGSSQMAFTFNVPQAGYTQFTITWNMPVSGTLNVRNANGSQSAPTSINTSPGNSYVFTKPPGVMTTQIYIGFISVGASWASERITEICWE